MGYFFSQFSGYFPPQKDCGAFFVDFIRLWWYPITMEQERPAEVSAEEALKKAEEQRKKAETAKKKARILRDREKNKYFEYYDDIKHDRNKEW